MSDQLDQVPETHVLAIASHVASGYVGNTMATFCMQSLGCEVTAINTVNYSNHVGYGRFAGRKTTPEEVAELYAGLQSANLHTAFDVLLSGYCPSAALVAEIGKIARDCKLRANTKPGSFFWVLDPVMGDNGHMYVAPDTLPAYQALLRDADLILPNQFEAEILSGVKIRGLASLTEAVAHLHRETGVPHVVVTSVRLDDEEKKQQDATSASSSTAKPSLSVIGSTATSTSEPRLFRITVPALPVYFSGTGDMFAALLVARLRQAAQAADLLDTASWRSSDDVSATDLPLARATERVLASMHAVLLDTAEHYDRVMRVDDGGVESKGGKGKSAAKGEEDPEEKTARQLKSSRAAEVRVVRNVVALRTPPNLHTFQAEAVLAEKE